MAKLTFKEIVDKLNEANVEISEFACDDITTEELGLGESEEIDSYGGEDQGSTWYSVRYFKEHDVYIRVDAYYSSYGGPDFYNSEYEEVFPTQVTKTEYLPKK